MDLQQIKGFIELIKHIDSKNNLKKSTKVLLPYMEWLVNRIEELELSRQNDRDAVSKLDTMAERIKTLEEK